MIDQSLESRSVQLPILSFPFQGPACDFEAPAAQGNGPQGLDRQAQTDLERRKIGGQEAARDRPAAFLHLRAQSQTLSSSAPGSEG